jgi:circadian clock protein KaiC
VNKRRKRNDSRLGQQQDRVIIRRLRSGVPGLDEILGGNRGGGLPEYSFNIIAGVPGSGKTTLAHQIMFANASATAPALYFTVLGEPAIKMLRYQQQFSFFDQSKMEGPEPVIRFVNLSQYVLEKDLEAVLDEIIKHVEATKAKIVVVDSFRTVVRKAHSDAAAGTAGEIALQSFVQRLALNLTSWQATTFLIGEHVEDELRGNPIFTVADGLVWLYQVVERNSVVRKLRVVKMRGVESVPGMHTFRISADGVQCFPRSFGLGANRQAKGKRRLSSGVAKLDAMMGGGIPEGESLLIVGPTGSGKSTLCMQFIGAGLRRKEPAVVAVFEELPLDYVHRARLFGIDFDKPQRDGKLKLVYLRPLDLSVEETVHQIVNAVKEIGAKRLVIDSLIGFELALAPGFREDFRESLFRMIAEVIRLGVTVYTTVELEDDFNSSDLGTFRVSFLSDDILRMRYVSINGQLRKMLTVVKMRRSAHSIDMHDYQITGRGLVIGEPLRGYRVLNSGIPELLSAEYRQNSLPRQDTPAKPANKTSRRPMR